MSIHVLLADDHPMVRVGLRFSLERSGRDIEVVGEANDGEEVLQLAATHAVHVFILDISMPRLNGLETTRELRRRRPGAKVIILSLHDQSAIVEEAFAAGACGYLTKGAAGSSVVEAVCAVHAGRRFLSPDLAGGRGHRRLRATRADMPVTKLKELTPQERRVLQLVASGRTTREIAVELNRAVETVRSHRKNLMAKLGIHKQTELVRFAIKEGILSD